VEVGGHEEVVSVDWLKLHLGGAKMQPAPSPWPASWTSCEVLSVKL
jgi:hypothetical protein